MYVYPYLQKRNYSAEELFRITYGMLKDEQLCLSSDAKEVCPYIYSHHGLTLALGLTLTLTQEVCSIYLSTPSI